MREEIFSQHVEQVLAEQHNMIPAQILAYNAKEQVATVIPLVKTIFKDLSTKDPIEIHGIPVVTYSNSTACIQLPIEAGNKGYLFFQDRSIDRLLSENTSRGTLPMDPVDPLDARLNDYSDCVFFPGFSTFDSAHGTSKDLVIRQGIPVPKGVYGDDVLSEKLALDIKTQLSTLTEGTGTPELPTPSIETLIGAVAPIVGAAANSLVSSYLGPIAGEVAGALAEEAFTQVATAVASEIDTSALPNLSGTGQSDDAVASANEALGQLQKIAQDALDKAVEYAQGLEPDKENKPDPSREVVVTLTETGNCVILTQNASITVTLEGSINIIAPAGVNIEGNLNVTGEVTAGNIGLQSHHHNGVHGPTSSSLP